MASTSTEPAKPSGVPEPPETQQAGASEGSAATGWLRYLSLLNELGPGQRISFTAELLALEIYLAGRIRHESKQLQSLITMDDVVDDTSYDDNFETEAAIDTLLRQLGLYSILEHDLAAPSTVWTKPEASSSRVVHVK
jgi:hypothetical protein